MAHTDPFNHDKDVAVALGIEPSTLASHKSRNKPPYKAIITYCHNNRLDVRKVLLDEYNPIMEYPKQMPTEAGKVRVKYFRTLDTYSKWLDGILSHKTPHTQTKG